MAKRAMMFCPDCRDRAQLNRVELVFESPEPDVYRCANGHSIPGYMNLMKRNPEMIRLEAHETPQPNQDKVDVWVDRGVLERFRKQYPAKLNATVESIMTLYLMGEPVIVDGAQAKRLNALGVRTGAEMVAALEVAKSLEDQLNTALERVSFFEAMFKEAVGSGAAG